MFDAEQIYELHQLKSRYFRLLDTKQWDEFRTLFAHDFVAYFEDTATPEATEATISGADAYLTMVSAVLATARTVHHGHSPEITLDSPTEAHGIWAMFDWVDNPAQLMELHGYGHYYERYVRNAAGSWQFQELRLTRLRVDMRPYATYGPWPAWTAADA